MTPTIRFSATGRVVVVAPYGEQDLATVEAVRDALQVALGTRARLCVVDLSDVTFMDSTVLGALVEAARRWRRQGRHLVCSGLHRNVERLFRLSAVDHALQAVDPVADWDAQLAALGLDGS